MRAWGVGWGKTWGIFPAGGRCRDGETGAGGDYGGLNVFGRIRGELMRAGTVPVLVLLLMGGRLLPVGSGRGYSCGRVGGVNPPGAVAAPGDRRGKSER